MKALQGLLCAGLPSVTVIVVMNCKRGLCPGKLGVSVPALVEECSLIVRLIEVGIDVQDWN